MPVTVITVSVAKCMATKQTQPKLGRNKFTDLLLLVLAVRIYTLVQLLC